MKATYEKMQTEGKIGPFTKTPEGMKVRDYSEYPKWVKTGKQKAGPRGTMVPEKRLVNSQREELAARAYGQIGDVPDPVVEEKNALAQENADLREGLAEMRHKFAEMQAQMADRPTPPSTDNASNDSESSALELGASVRANNQQGAGMSGKPTQTPSPAAPGQMSSGKHEQGVSSGSAMQNSSPITKSPTPSTALPPLPGSKK